MSERNTVLRSLHDLGLAAWFGGTLANAVALNAAAGAVDRPTERGRAANVGWDRWTPVNLAAIGAHLVGASGLLAANADRVRSQRGVGASSAVKTGLTVAALGLTAYSRVLGRKVDQAGDVPVASGAKPDATTPPEVAKAQEQLRSLQWAIPGVTGALIVVTALQGEQQRADQVLKGVPQRLVAKVGR